jgi:hypothetical protein
MFYTCAPSGGKARHLLTLSGFLKEIETEKNETHQILIPKLKIIFLKVCSLTITQGRSVKIVLNAINESLREPPEDETIESPMRPINIVL